MLLISNAVPDAANRKLRFEKQNIDHFINTLFLFSASRDSVSV